MALGGALGPGLGAAVTPRYFCVAGVALGDIHLDFTWQAWHNLTSTVVLRGRRGTDGPGWRPWAGIRRRRDARDAAPLLRGRRGTWWHPPWFHVAGVAQPHIYRRFAWQAWDRWPWVARLDWFRRRRDARDAAPLLRGRRGTWWHPPWFHVAGVGQMALGGALGPGLGAAVTPVTPRHFCVAGVALGDIHLDFTWQAWHNLTSTVVLRGRRGTDGAGWRAWTGLGAAVTPVTPRHFCVAGVALGDIHLDFTWQAWHNLTSTVVLRGRRGTDGTGWRAWTGLGAAVTPVTPRHFCVAGLALGDIHLDFTWQAWHNLTFAWQAWHNLTSTFALRGRRGKTHVHRHFAWQAWHKLTSTVVLRGRRGTHGTEWRGADMTDSVSCKQTFIMLFLSFCFGPTRSCRQQL